MASASVIASSACLLPEYAPAIGADHTPEMELIFTIRPFDSMTIGANAFVTRKTPKTFTSKMNSTSSCFAFVNGANTATPALFTSPHNPRPSPSTTRTSEHSSSTSRRTAMMLSILLSASMSASLRAPA